MNMTETEKLNFLKDEIKKLDSSFNNKAVSIKINSGTYDTMFYVTLKTPKALKNKDKIETICNSIVAIDSGEILTNCNTFVSVGVNESAYSDYLDVAKAIIKDINETNNPIVINNLTIKRSTPTSNTLIMNVENIELEIRFYKNYRNLAELICQHVVVK